MERRGSHDESDMSRNPTETHTELLSRKLKYTSQTSGDKVGVIQQNFELIEISTIRNWKKIRGRLVFGVLLVLHTIFCHVEARRFDKIKKNSLWRGAKLKDARRKAINNVGVRREDSSAVQPGMLRQEREGRTDVDLDRSGTNVRCFCLVTNPED